MPSTRPSHRQRCVLGIVCLATAMLMLDIAVVNTGLPSVGRDLHSGLTGVQWVIDAYTVALAAVVLSAGSLADRHGRRLVFGCGVATFTATSMICGIAGGVALLDAARAAQGIGAAMMFASSLAILADAFPSAHERAGAMAAFGATIGAAFAIGPAVGGALTSAFGWRSVFFVNVPLGLIALAGTIAWVRESRAAHASPVDWPGQLTLCGGLLLLVLGLLRGNVDGWGSGQVVAELSGAGLLLAAFVGIEARVRTPMLPLGMFRRPDFTAAQVAAFAVSSSFFALYLYLTLYLQDVLGLSPVATGAVYLPGTALLFTVSGASAQLTRRIRPATLVIVGLVLVAGGLVLTTIAGVHSSWAAIVPGNLVVCIGTGLLNPSLAALALGAGPPETSGLLAGVNDAFRQGGIAVGVAVFGALVPAGVVLGHRSSGAYVTGLHHALLLGAGIAAAGALVTGYLVRPLGERSRAAGESPARGATPGHAAVGATDTTSL